MSQTTPTPPMTTTPTRQPRWVLISAVLILALIVGLVALSAVLTPDNLNPAFAVAVDFVNRAGTGDDGALELLGPQLAEYVAQACPSGSVSACVQGYTPPEWGALVASVFRRSIPDPSAAVGAWDILQVATYERDQGFAGVCIYTRAEQIAPREGDPYAGWRVTRWSGFVSCDLPDAGLQGLSQPAAPNYAPPRS